MVEARLKLDDATRGGAGWLRISLPEYQDLFFARHDEGGPSGTFSGCRWLSLSSVSKTSLHESGHCLVGRYLDFPIKLATIVSNEHFFVRRECVA